MKVDISKGLTADRISGLCTDDSIVGILDASDHEFIDIVSPFLGALVDTCCRGFGITPVISVFVKFVQLVNGSARINRRPIYSDEDLK